MRKLGNPNPNPNPNPNQAVYCVRKLGIPQHKLNPLGGAIALGHPLGCTGARQAATLRPSPCPTPSPHHHPNPIPNPHPGPDPNPKPSPTPTPTPTHTPTPSQVATLLHHMRRTGQRYGVVSMCIGTGMGAAAVFEAE